jgi:hypothetical protein
MKEKRPLGRGKGIERGSVLQGVASREQAFCHPGVVFRVADKILVFSKRS